MTAVLESEVDWTTVKTTRGEIEARNVIHSTNGWLGHLVTELRPFISLMRANLLRQLPRQPKSRMDRSFWLRYSEKEYDYLIQRLDKSYITDRAFAGRNATTDDSAHDFQS